jgi:hypothetical protein
MRAVIDYIKHAMECRSLAERMTQPDDKRVLQELAQAWEKIAILRQRDLLDAKDSNRD